MRILVGWLWPLLVAVAIGQEHPVVPPVLVPGVVFEGTLDTTCPVIESPELARVDRERATVGRRFSLDLPVGTTTIECRSHWFDAYLVVRRIDGRVLAEVDGGLVGTHARFALEMDGPLAVHVDACALRGGEGPFELVVRAGEPPARDRRQRAEENLADAQAEHATRLRALGGDHVDVLRSRHRLACALRDAGRHEPAEAEFLALLEVSVRVLGADADATALSWNELGVLRLARNAPATASEAFANAAAAWAARFGADDSRTLTARLNMAVAASAGGDAAAAEALLVEVVEGRKRTFGPEHPATLDAQSSLATAREAQGRWRDAMDLLTQVHATLERVAGAGDPRTLRAAASLAVLVEREGRVADALDLQERVLAGREARLGADHPETLSTMVAVGALRAATGRVAEGRATLERVLSSREKTLGADHVEVANVLSELGRVLRAERRLAEAQAALERALSIQQAASAGESPRMVATLHRLALVQRDRGEFAAARANFERVLALRSARATGDPVLDRGVSTTRSELLGLLLAEGRVEEARAGFRAHLEELVGLLGAAHPDVLTSEHNLARCCSEAGAHDEARDRFERVLAGRREVLGELHPDTRATALHAAYATLDLGDRAAARTLVDREWSLGEARFEEEARAATPDRLIGAIEERRRWLELRLALAANPGERYADVLAFKGSFASELLARREVLAESPESALAHAELTRVRGELADLFDLRQATSRQFEGTAIEALRRRRHELETRIVAEARDRQRPTLADAAAIGAVLPEGAVLLDFVAVSRPDAVPHASRMLAFVVRSGATAAIVVDLGPLDGLNAAIREFLAVMTATRGAAAVAGAAADVPGRALAARLWQPLAAHVGSAPLVLLVPDGPLALLPFGCLPTGDGKLLIERHAFVQLEDATRLVREPRRAAVGGSLLVVGAVDFDATPGDGAATAAGDAARSRVRGDWIPLSATAVEAAGIERLHSRARPDHVRLLLRDAAPTEERLLTELTRHAHLHVATHGYFLVDGLRSLAEECAPADRERLERSAEREWIAADHPSVLCGLACAGANVSAAERRNGLLTGEEIAALDLSGCDLAVLSACETGLGRLAASGQGAMSLARAFRDAGAKTVISSLWRVRDDSTKDLMLDFYDRLWNKRESKRDALRNAQLAMLQKNRQKYGDTLPATWGAFVLTGEWE